MEKSSLFLILLLLLFSWALHTQSGLIIEPAEIILEEGALSALFNEGLTIHVRNRDSRMVEMALVSTGENIIINPSSYTFSCTEDIPVKVRYEGDIPEPENMFYPLLLMNKTDRITETFLIYHPLAYNPPGETRGKLNPREYDIVLTYYYSPYCKSCRDFLDREIPLLEKELDLKIGMEQRNVFDKENLAHMNERLNEAGMDTDALPLLDTGEVILAGEEAITDWLHAALKGEPLPYSIKNGKKTSPPRAPLWLMVAGAGLLDGINPCAFSTLIFLLAYLGLKKRSRGEILGVGMAFSLTVFLTYTALGAGAFVLLRQSQNFGGISDIIKWTGAGALILLSILSFRDWIRVRRGDLKEMALQLSPAMKKAVHRSVREGVQSAVPLIGAVLMGFMVTIYELGCTGQIYLPTLYLMTRQGERGGWGLLLLYNVIFVIPLLSVFLLVYKGLTAERLGSWFQKRLAMVKLITALFFLIAGIGVILL